MLGNRSVRRRLLLGLGWGLVVLVLAFGVLQLLPYGRDKTNPVAHTEPSWDSERTRELVVGACFDCHSNRTDWPWYSSVAPFSWLVADDVNRGREAVNFSLWPYVHEGEEAELEDLTEVVLDGSMPPRSYRLVHSDARLSDGEKRELVDGLRGTFARAGVTGEEELGDD